MEEQQEKILAEMIRDSMKKAQALTDALDVILGLPGTPGTISEDDAAGNVIRVNFRKEIG